MLDKKRFQLFMNDWLNHTLSRRLALLVCLVVMGCTKNEPEMPSVERVCG